MAVREFRDLKLPTEETTASPTWKDMWQEVNQPNVTLEEWRAAIATFLAKAVSTTMSPETSMATIVTETMSTSTVASVKRILFTDINHVISVCIHEGGGYVIEADGG